MADVTADTQAPYVDPKTRQEFPILSFEEDLGKIGAHLKAQRIAEAQEFFKTKKELAATMDWQRLLIDIETTPVILHFIQQYIQSPAGATKAIELSLGKLAKTPADVRKIMADFLPAERIQLALIVSGTVPRPTPEPRADNPLSSNSDAAPSPPSEGAARKRSKRTGVLSSAA